MDLDKEVFLRDCREITMLKSSNFVTSPSSTDAAVGSTEEINVQSDFNGFPSRPRLIFRTGLPEDLVQCEQPEREEPRPVFSHPIRDSWPLLGKEIYVYLDSVDVQWSTIDPIRFALKGAPPGPLHLWIGVNPGSLNLDDAKTAAAGCKSILSNAGFADVEIAFRESILSRLVGPNLLSPTSTRDLEAEIDNFASPFTAALGLYIAPRETPHVEATGGLYICEAGGSDRLFLLTARHAVLPMKDHPDTLYDNMTQTQRHRPGRRMPKHDIILLGQKAYTDAIDSVMGRIGILLDAIDIAKDEIDYCGPPLKQKRQSTIVALQNQIDDLTTLHNKIGTQWGSATMRIIGRVAYAPPIAVIDLGEKRFMEDWALVELDRSKFESGSFRGNVVFVGIKDAAKRAEFNKKMHPNHTSSSQFKCPPDGLLKINGVTPAADIINPKQLDSSGEPCLPVVKNGMASGITIGHVTGIQSFVRHYPDYGIHEPSMEVAVYTPGKYGSPFSARGDSGAVAVDGEGRVLGMVTGGTGREEGNVDVTYLTAYYILEERIRAVFPTPCLYPSVSP